MKLHCLCLGQHEVFQEKRPLLPLSNSPPRTGKKDQHFWFWGLSCIGEGNGNPLQCSCLENPRDGAAWWVAIYGDAKSQTRLKRLSSSSSRSPKYKWAKFINQKTEWLNRLKNKTQLQATFRRLTSALKINRLKVKGWKMMFQANGSQQKQE